MSGGGGGARRTVLITGTSSGIGLATAIACAREGLATVATMRDPSRADALLAAARDAGVEVDVRQLDVTDAASVEACIADVEKAYGRLDALVNNAGVASSDPTMEMSTMDALRATMEVNFFGVIAVSRLAMPLLRASGGRLVTVGSVHGVVGQPFNESYCAAKSAVEGFMEALAPVAAAQGVTVSIVVPGFVPDTSFGVFPDVNRSTIQAASGVYASTFGDYIGWISAQGWETAAQMSGEVAEVVVRTLTEERPAFRIPTSRWAQEYIDHKLADRDGSVIQSLARTWIGLQQLS